MTAAAACWSRGGYSSPPLTACAGLLSHPDPYPFKVAAIAAWMRRFPRQHVILVGDSGEKDPEVFARMLAQFPAQIDAVCIRDVTREPRSADRYTRLFGANGRVHIFTEPGDLLALVDRPH